MAKGTTSGSVQQRTPISNSKRETKEELDGIATGRERAAPKARDMAKALAARVGAKAKAKEKEEEREFMV